jgi:Rrf2 family protein
MLTMKTKYALRALAIMAEAPQDSWPAKAIAEAGDIPLKFLEGILSTLRRQGIITSKRGMAGGHRLARAPKEIGVGDIVRIFDKMIAPIPCASLYAYKPCDECPNPRSCDIRHVMMDVRNAMAAVMDKRSIQDLVDINRAAGKAEKAKTKKDKQDKKRK